MKKKKIRLKRWVKVALLSLIFCFMASFVNIRHQNNDKIVVQNDQKVAENIEEMAQNIENTAENEEKIEQIEEPQEIVVPESHTYRMTSYYPYESSNCTGSGKCTQHFEVNDKGWYLYDGKIVLAAATIYLQKSYGTISGRHYFKYYDEVDITIDGNTYRGIILDSCGACMYITYEERIDLFVSSSDYVIDRGYRGNNPVKISW